MEGLVSKNNGTNELIGKVCLKCKNPIVDGDLVVTRRRGHVYHKSCWEGCFI
jgi:hypothetical protein